MTLLRFTGLDRGRPYCFGAAFSALGVVEKGAPKYWAMVRSRTLSDAMLWATRNPKWLVETL